MLSHCQMTCCHIIKIMNDTKIFFSDDRKWNCCTLQLDTVHRSIRLLTSVIRFRIFIFFSLSLLILPFLKGHRLVWRKCSFIRLARMTIEKCRFFFNFHGFYIHNSKKLLHHSLEIISIEIDLTLCCI